jgi:hypothetical protein
MRTLIASSTVALFLVLGLAAGCSDKDSPEACQYATTMNLDAHNYDAVLQSPCATTMQLAAAHFGKAGYDTRTVINRFIDANSAAADRDLGVYMGSLVSKVTTPMLDNLSIADLRYASIPPSAGEYLDAQFVLSLVRAVRALAIIKAVINNTGTGVLSECDINGNSIPDEADAVSCVLVSAGSTTPTTDSCVFSAWTGTSNPEAADIVFSGQTGTYRGVTATLPGTPTGSCSANYQKLLYLDPGTNTYRAAITVGTCQASDAQMWPCPSAAAQDFLSSFQADVSGSVSALDTSLTGTGSTASEVQQSIENIRTQACGADGVCTANDLANYIQDRL